MLTTTIARPDSASSPATRRRTLLIVLAALGMVAPACSEKPKPQGVGIVVADASSTAPAEAGAPDITQCPGCQQLAPMPTWTFEGIYRDATCTEPLAQLTVPVCVTVPALGAASLTYVDEIGARKANETANVTLVDQIAPEAIRYRKSAKGCAKANEGAVALTPLSCANSRACRDAAGAMTCTACRTFASGCPDVEETRLYASINDPVLKGGGGQGGGGGNLARLAQCCAALSAQAKALGASPEAGMLVGIAAQCTALVRAAGPNGNAPELGAIRAALAGRPVPAVCAGF